MATNKPLQKSEKKPISGWGRLPLLIGGVFVVLMCIGVALMLRGGNKAAQAVSEVQTPEAPPAPLTVQVSQSERERRNDQGDLEGSDATRQGRSYQQPLDLHNQKTDGRQTANNTDLDFGGQKEEAKEMPVPQYAAGLKTGRIQLGGSEETAQVAAQAIAARTSGDAQKQAQFQAQLQQARAIEQADFDGKLAAARQEREQWVNAVRNQALTQAGILIGNESSGGVFSSMGLATGMTWETPEEPKDDLNLQNAMLGAPSDSGMMVIQAGEMMYATLDVEVDTDDGDRVLGTIRGGKFDGRRIIGQVEQANDNIRLHFTLMSGAKNERSISIDAIALRPEDAKQGMADIKNRHMLSRLAAMAVSALFTGYGDAWGDTSSGTTTITENGTVIVTNDEEPTRRRIRGNIARNFGYSMAGEMERYINQPTTYKVKAGRGFVLLFLSDLEIMDDGNVRTTSTASAPTQDNKTDNTTSGGNTRVAGTVRTPQRTYNGYYSSSRRYGSQGDTQTYGRGTRVPGATIYR